MFGLDLKLMTADEWPWPYTPNLSSRPDPLVRLIRIPVLLSDSKGLSLQIQVTVKPETFIEFWCYPGATAENGLDYLRRSLASHLQKLHPMTLCVWVGTCNLKTKHQNGRIELTGRDSNPAYNLVNTLKDIYHFVRTFDQWVKLVFLHISILFHLKLLQAYERHKSWAVLRRWLHFADSNRHCESLY